MKTIKPLLIPGFVLLLALASCSVEKRVYMKGYHLSWKKSKPNANPNNLVTNTTNKAVDLKKSEKIRHTNTPDILTIPEQKEPPTASVDHSALSINKSDFKPTIFSIPETPQECDQITMKNGEEMKVKIMEITSDAIKYKFCDDLDGPLRNVKKTEVFMLKYSNGTKEIFSPDNSSNSLPSNNQAGSSGPVAPLKTQPLGIVGFLTSIVGIFVASVPLGILSIVFGGLGLKKIKREPQKFKGKGLAITAIVIGIIDVVLGIIAIAMLV